MGRDGESPGGNRGFQENRGATNAQTMPEGGPEVKSGQRFVPFAHPRWMDNERAIMRSSVSPSAKLAWIVLARFAGRDGTCNPSHKTLAREIGVKPRRVRDVLAELEAVGLIEREAPDQGGRAAQVTTRYFFCWHAILEAKPTAVKCPRPRAESDPRATAVKCPTPTAVKCRTLGQDTAAKEIILNQSPKNTHTKAVCVPSASLSEDQEEYISLLSKRQYVEGRVRNLGAFRAKLREKGRTGELDTVELKALRKWNEEHEAAKQAARFEAIENAAYGVWYDAPGPDRAKAFVSGSMDAALAQQGPEVREALERLFASEIAEARNPRSEPASTPPKYEPEAAPW